MTLSFLTMYMIIFSSCFVCYSRCVVCGTFLSGRISTASTHVLLRQMGWFERQANIIVLTTQRHLHNASQVQPSAKREGFATVPGVSWSDIGALASVREELSLSILEPIAYPEVRHLAERYQSVVERPCPRLRYCTLPPPPRCLGL